MGNAALTGEDWQAQVAKAVGAAVDHTKRTDVAWSAFTRDALLERVLNEASDDGMLGQAGLYRSAMLLKMDVTPEVVGRVLERIDVTGSQRVPVSSILALTGRVGVRFASPRSPAGGPSRAARESRAWRDDLRGFNDHVDSRRRHRLPSANEKHFAQWETKSDDWEMRLVKAEQRRLHLYRGILPPASSNRTISGPGGRGNRAGGRNGVGGGGVGGGVGGGGRNGAARGTRRFARTGRVRNARRTQYLESVAKDSTLVELQDITHFTVGDLEKLRERFFEQAMSTSLSVDKFCAFLTSEYPQLAGHQSLLLRLFTLFDEDNNGTVSFQELIMGLTKTLNCSMDDKIHLMFSCIDLSSDGRINLQELTHVIAKSQGDLQASIAYSRDFFSYLDRDNNGTISLDEFHKALQGNTKLFKSLVRALPLPTDAFDVMQEIKAGSSQNKKGQRFNLDGLKQLYREYASMHKRSRNRKRQISRVEFRQIMGKQFGLQRLDQQKLLDRLFDSFDTDQSNSVSFEEILRGLSLLINQQSDTEEDNEECLDFYFDLFDKDQRGELLDEEIRGLLNNSEDQLHSVSRETQNLLQALTSNANGNTISEKDLIHLTSEHPQLLQILKHNLR